LFGVIYNALILLWTTEYGLGLPLEEIDLSPEEILYHSMLILYFVELTYAASLACSKLAILCFYWKLFRLSKLRVPIITLMVASVVWLIIRVRFASFRGRKTMG
jgi:hypothetical protein